MIVNGMSKMHGSPSAYKDGQVWMATDSVSARLWISYDYGITWEENLNLTARSFNDCAISGDGSTMIVCDNGSLAWSSNDYGASWTSSSWGGQAGYYNPKISQDGKYMIVGTFSAGPRRSANYGASWTSCSGIVTTQDTFAHGISSTGQYQFVSGQNYRWDNNNYGSGTWTQSGYQNPQKYARDGDMDFSGDYITTGSNGNITGGDYVHVSDDNGATWTEPTDLFQERWSTVGISGNGEYQGVFTEGADTDVYFSSNYGVNWSANTTDFTDGYWTNIGFSGDGKYGVVQTGSKYIRSDDYGVTWTDEGKPDASFTSIAGICMNKKEI